MDAKYLQEIKARTAQELTDDDYHNLKIADIAKIRMDSKRLVAEVERLQAAQLKAFNAGYDVQQKHLDETVRQYGAEIDRLKIERDTAIALHKDCANELSNAHHNHTDDFMRLNAEISTLKRALELACQYGERWYDSAMESREDYTPVCANMLLNNFIKQAQEES